MKKQTFKIFFIFIATLFLSCSDNEKIADLTTIDELPPITQTGENTFGCKINGQVMIPRDSRVSQLGGIPTGVTYASREVLNTYDWIKASDRYTSTGGVAFKIPNLQNLKVGEYEVKTVVGGFASTHPNIVYM